MKRANKEIHQKSQNFNKMKNFSSFNFSDTRVDKESLAKRKVNVEQYVDDFL